MARDTRNEETPLTRPTAARNQSAVTISLYPMPPNVSLYRLLYFDFSFTISFNPKTSKKLTRQHTVSSAVLFYLAKKREWRVRENLRRSARKVVTALTPRRSEFPRSVKGFKDPDRDRDHVPPTPRLRPEDLEKGLRAEVRRSPDGGGSSGGKKKKQWPRK